MIVDEQLQIINNDVISLSETWLTYEPVLPFYLKNSHKLVEFSPAIKDKEKGRASGGLTIIMRKDLEFKIVEKN